MFVLFILKYTNLLREGSYKPTGDLEKGTDRHVAKDSYTYELLLLK